MKSSFIFKLMVAVIMITQVSSAAAEEGWTNIGVSINNNMRYDIQNGSFEISKTKGGFPIAVVVGRVTDHKTSNISVYKWYVPLQACIDQLGKVVSLNVSGEYLFENDFVIGGGNMAAAMGETICGVAKSYFTEINEKSL